MFLGRRDKTDDVIAVSVRGIKFAKAFRWHPEHKRWGVEAYGALLVALWSLRGIALVAHLAQAQVYHAGGGKARWRHGRVSRVFGRLGRPQRAT